MKTHEFPLLHRLLSSVRLVFPILLLFFLGNIIPNSLKAQAGNDSTNYYQIANDRLIELRTELVAQQKLWPDLVRIVPPFITPEIAGREFNASRELLESLLVVEGIVDPFEPKREELRANIRAMVDRGTASPAVLAIYQAETELILEEIRIIEIAIGSRSGEFTTRWNVLTDHDLLSMDGRLSDQIRAIAGVEATYPQQPANLILRRELLKKWQIDLQTELKRRKAHPTTQLKGIDSKRSPSEVQQELVRLQEWQSAHRSKSFEHKLRFQAALLRDQSPGDVSIVLLQERVGLVDPPSFSKQESFQRLQNRGPPSLWSNPFEEVSTLVNDALLEEQKALGVGDFEALAKARASRRMGQEWLRLAFGDDGRPIAHFDYAESEVLFVLHKQYEAHYKQLLKTSYADIIQIAELKFLFEQTHHVLLARHDNFGFTAIELGSNPSRGPPPPIGLSRASPSPALGKLRLNSAVIAFESRFEGCLKSFELMEAQKIVDNRVALLPDQQVKDQITRLKTELANLKGQAWTERLDILLRYQNQVLETTGSRPGNPPKMVHANLDVQIESQSKKSAPGKKSYRVNLENRLPYPKDFDQSFPQKDINRSHQKLINKIEVAPGGIIIDPVLPDSFCKSIQAAQVDLVDYQIYWQIADEWYPLALPKDPAILRQAWAFAKDGRVVAVDLRSLPPDEKDYWIAPYFEPFTKPDTEYLRQILAELSTINLHPALEDTDLGKQFIQADQIIFDVLPQKAFVLEGGYRKSPFDLAGLRDSFIQDQCEHILKGEANRYAISKSIISATIVSVAVDSTIRFSPDLKLALYRKDKEAYRQMEKTTNWFDKNTPAIRSHTPTLESIATFVSVVAVIKTCLQHGIVNNFDELLFFTPLYTETPDLMYEGKLEFDEVIRFLNGQH